MKRLALPILLALPFLFGSLASAENTWTEVRSPHFTVITDAGEKKGRDVAQRLEQMRAASQLMLNRAKVNIPVPVVVVAFKNSKELRPYAPLFNGKAIELAGLYQQGEDRNYILLDLAANDAVEAILHEYGHMLLHANFWPVPLWFDEGFACYFQTVTVDHKTMKLGTAPAEAGYVFSNVSLIPVEQLLTVGQQSKAYNETSDRRNMFYMESWLLVHYIYDKKLLKPMVEYAELTEHHAPPAEALQKAFGMTPQQLQKELEKQMHGFTVTTYSLTDEIRPTDFTARPLRELDAQVTLADVHLHEPDYQEQAVKEFEAILQTDPQNPGAHRGLGYAYLRRGQLDQASEHFQAAAKDTSDARVLYYSAVLTRSRSRVTREDLASMKEQAAKAVTLDPEFAAAHDLLAYADAGLGDYAGAESAMTAAVRLDPYRDEYRLFLGEIYMAQQKWDTATSLFTDLKSNGDPTTAERAAEALDLIARSRTWHDVRVRMDGGQVMIEGEQEPAPRVRPAVEEEPQGPSEPPVVDKRAIQFAKGTLLSVDCSQDPGATITVLVGAKRLSLKTPDRNKVLLMNANAFSCAWMKRKVAVNYRASGATTGDLVSVELQ